LKCGKGDHRLRRPSVQQYQGIGDAFVSSAGNAVAPCKPCGGNRQGGRVVFNTKANDYRLIVVVQYENGVVMIRFFGSHEEYDKVDAETV
jgi:mRNA-degrading endonuclease RelE of RelBE toxin-antitoxin system